LLYVVNVHRVYSVEVGEFETIITLGGSTYTVWQFVVFLFPL